MNGKYDKCLNKWNNIFSKEVSKTLTKSSLETML